MKLKVTSLVLVLTLLCVTDGMAGDPRIADLRILNGRPAGEGELPFAVALVLSGVGSSFSGQFCTGVLIDRRHVLTAAHCTRGLSANQIDIVLGRTRLSSEGSGQRIPAAEIREHRGYDNQTLSKDLSIITLSRDTNLAPVRIADRAFMRSLGEGEPLVISGWGVDAFGTPMDQLQVAVVEKWAKRRCISNYETAGEVVDETMLCAASPGTDTCNGDSGGPLVSYKAGTPVLVGITSWGIRCGVMRFPGVYQKPVESPTFFARFSEIGYSLE